MPANQHHTATARKSASRPRKPTPPHAIPAAARALLSAKTAARMAEMDAALDTAPGHGVAEVALGDLIDDVTGGEFDGVLDGWNWENPGRAAAALKRLGDRWRREDSGEAAPEPQAAPPPSVRLDGHTEARLLDAVTRTGMSPAALIAAALDLLLSGGASAPEPPDPARFRRGNPGWPEGGAPPAPTVDDLLPPDAREKLLQLWLATGTNVIHASALRIIGAIGEGGKEAIRLVADSMETDIHDRLSALAAAWEGGAVE